jgi:hypothetical protein
MQGIKSAAIAPTNAAHTRDELAARIGVTDRRRIPEPRKLLAYPAIRRRIAAASSVSIPSACARNE